MTKRNRCRCAPTWLMLIPAGLALVGCAATVSPRLPSPPQIAAGNGPIKLAVVGDAATNALVTEVQTLLNPLGQVEQRAARESDDLSSVCALGYDLAARPTAGRTAFASNAAERNTLLIYESVIVVGIPVTLISAASWPWYGELTADGDLETLWCAGGTPVHTRAFAAVRAEGRGFISQDRLRNELQPHVGLALGRALVEAAARCGRFQKGGEQCSGEKQ